MFRSRDGTWLTTRSPIAIFPSLISSRPATIRRAVVLPLPEGPTMTTNSPSRISRVKSSTARVPSGKIFATCSNATPAMALVNERAGTDTDAGHIEVSSDLRSVLREKAQLVQRLPELTRISVDAKGAGAGQLVLPVAAAENAHAE